MKVILTMICNDAFIPLLLDMLESLGDRLDNHALGICDLGLNDESKAEIRKLKPDVMFKEVSILESLVDLPEYYKGGHSMAFLCKPFANIFFPDYDGYVHIDADIWFPDPSGLDDLIEAGQKHGVACVDEPKLTRKRRVKLFGMNLFYRKFPIFGEAIGKYYGREEALRLSGRRDKIMNGGFSYIKGKTIFWQLYQDAGRKLINHGVTSGLERGFCDQTAFLYALVDSKVPHVVLPCTHNCIGKERMLFDKERLQFFHPSCPNEPVKVIHIVGAGNKKYKRKKVKTTDGGTVKTAFTYRAVQDLKRELKAG